MKQIDKYRGYPFIDAVAHVECQTESSVALQISYLSDELHLANRIVKTPNYQVIGWLDIHYPCLDDSLWVRGALPSKYPRDRKPFFKRSSI